MTQLPKGWRWVKLGDVCEFVYGSSLPQRSRQKGDVHIYGSNGIVGTHNKAITEGETIVIGRKGSIGEIHFSEVSCWPIDTTYFIDQNYSNADLKWLTYWLQALDFRKLNKASGVPGLNRNDAYALEIPLPPLDEQRRIVAILNEKMTAIDRARAAAQAQLEAAQSLPAAYLRQVFDGEEAKGWPRKRLGEILHQRREIIHPRDNPSGPGIFVGLEHIESGVGVRTGSDKVEMAELTGRKPKFYQGDIVYGYLRPYLNKVWIAEFDGLCSVDQYVYFVDHTITDAEFVTWFMRSSIYLTRAPIGLTPGQLPRIRTEEVAMVEINFPSLERQRCVVDEIRTRIKRSLQLVESVAAQLDDINALPAALLRQAFAGELGGG